MTTKTVTYSTDEIYPDFMIDDDYYYSEGEIDLDIDFINQYNYHRSEYLRMRDIIEDLIEDQA